MERQRKRSVDLPDRCVCNARRHPNLAKPRFLVFFSDLSARFYSGFAQIGSYKCRLANGTVMLIFSISLCVVQHRRCDLAFACMFSFFPLFFALPLYFSFFFFFFLSYFFFLFNHDDLVDPTSYES